MILRVFCFFLFSVPGLAAAADLCTDYPRSIEPDMQIHEGDLSTRSAREATERLRELPRDAADDQAREWGVLNRLQVLTGYTLRQQALEDRSQYGAASEKAEASTREFCTWLTRQGFWYD